MIKIVSEIKDCSECPAHTTSNQSSSDDFDRMEDWNCKDMEGKKVMGAVEWHDKVPIPDWCPRRIENQK